MPVHDVRLTGFHDRIAALVPENDAQRAARDRAAQLAEHSLQLNHRHTSTLRVKTIALQSLGREAEAHACAKTLMRREPHLTVERYLATHPAGPYQTGRDWAYALRQAGVPAT